MSIQNISTIINAKNNNLDLKRFIVDENRNLFKGAARLGLLLGTLNLPWSRMIPFVSCFTDELSTYQELSLDSCGKVLGLMTHGKEKSFAFRVARYMEDHGIDQDRLRRFLVRARFFKYKNLYFKVEIGPNGPFQFSYYFRQRAPLDVAVAWLKDTGVNDEDIALMRCCARELYKETTHFLAAAESLGGDSLQKVYFSQPIEREAWSRVRNGGSLAGLNKASWKCIDGQWNSLVNKPVFFSLGFSNGKLNQGAKLDVQGVNSETVETLMKETGQPKEACDRTKLLLELHGKEKFDYFGIHLLPDASIKTKVYVYKSAE